MKFYRGQKVRIKSKSVGIPFDESDVVRDFKKNGFLSYYGSEVTDYYTPGREIKIHNLMGGEYYADFIEDDIIPWFETFVEIDE